MKIKLLEPFLDVETGNGSQGGAAPETNTDTNSGNTDPGVDKNGDQPLENTNQNTDVPEGAEGAEEEEKDTEGEEKKSFNFDDMDFSEPEKEINLTTYEGLRERGINIEDPQFKKSVSILEECGMTDPNTISNFLLKIQEKQSEIKKAPSVEEIQENIRKNLNKEEQENYKAIGNMFANIFDNDPEAMALVNRDIMSNPALIKIVNKIRKYYSGSGANPSPKNTPATVSKHTGNTGFTDAVNEVNKEIAKKYVENNKNITASEKQAIIKKIRQKVKSSDIQRFDNYFN